MLTNIKEISLEKEPKDLNSTAIIDCGIFSPDFLQ